ncbi:hypothetical protein HK098_002223 [Nowakowskiella sp. JEL0407]|nr:hypothetical protein HK098_002223 [Nowakowskiella sp. JEL0407]
MIIANLDTLLKFLNKRRNEKIIDSTKIAIPDSEKSCTVLKSIQQSPFVLVGSSSQSNNLHVIENLSSTTGWNQNTKAAGLQLKSAFSLPNPIYDMDVYQDKLVTAGPNGTAQIFKLNVQKLNEMGKGIEHVADCKLGEESLDKVRISPPNMMTASVKISKVEFSIHNPNIFFGTEGVNLKLWDVEKSVLKESEAVAKDTIRASAWSSYLPGIIAVGGCDRNFQLIDSKNIKSQGKGIAAVWKVDSAHESSITDVQFNPFIPYWVATSGEDGTLKIWDLRYLKFPVARIDTHYHSVESIAWSNTHSEIITTGSSDRNWRAFAISTQMIIPRKLSEDYFVGFPGSEWIQKAKFNKYATADARQKVLETPLEALRNGNVCAGGKLIAEYGTEEYSPIVCVQSSLTHLDTFYSLSAAGELSAHTIRPELWEQITPHKFSSHRQPREYDVEREIYSRDFASAYAKISSISKSARAEGKLISTHEADLIDLCTPRPEIDSQSWKIANTEDSENETNERAVATTANTKFEGRISRVTRLMQDYEANNSKQLLVYEKNEKDREMVDRFRADLDSFSYFLPPNFTAMTQWVCPANEKSKLEFENLVLRFNTLVHVAKGEYEEVAKAENAIIKGMESDNTYMDGETLTYILKSILPFDYPRGLHMGIRFAEIYEDTNARDFSELNEMLLLMLYPTTYDSESDIISFFSNSQTSIKNNLESGQESPAVAKLSRNVIELKQEKIKEYIEMSSKSVKAKLETVAVGNKSEKEVFDGNVINVVIDDYDKKSSGGEKSERRVLDVKQNFALDAILRNPKSVMFMIKREMSFIKIFLRNNENLEDDIVRLFTPVDKTNIRATANTGASSPINLAAAINAGVTNATDPGMRKSTTLSTMKPSTSFVAGAGSPASQTISLGERTISVAANKIYLDSLLFTKRFEEYFAVGLELVVLFSSFDFSRLLLKSLENEGIPSLKTHIDKLTTDASTTLSQGITLSQKTTSTISAFGILLSNGIRIQKDAIFVVVRVLSVFSQLLEGFVKVSGGSSSPTHNMDKDSAVIVAVAEKLMMGLITILTQTSASLFKMLETMERIFNRNGGEKSFHIKESAQLVKDSIVENLKLFPRWATEKRLLPSGSSLIGGAVLTAVEELQSINDRLGKYTNIMKSMDGLAD